jgi:hypothetical protein
LGWTGCGTPGNPDLATGAEQEAKSRDDADVLSKSVEEHGDVRIPPLEALLGQVDPAQDSAFSELPESMSSRGGLHLRNEVCEAFQAMHAAAAVEGIELVALSATRPFGHQASIWNRKWNRAQTMGLPPLDRARTILMYSSMPGSSRHHWGTDVDIHSLEPADFQSGKGAEVLGWLREHGGDFGFVEVYTDDSTRTGYQPEAWHWSYRPLAAPYLAAINDAASNGTLPPFSGFEGAVWADSLRIVEAYINGVSDDARGVTEGRPLP